MLVYQTWVPKAPQAQKMYPKKNVAVVARVLPRLESFQRAVVVVEALEALDDLDDLEALEALEAAEAAVAAVAVVAGFKCSA
jgi:hypothetical protein